MKRTWIGAILAIACMAMPMGEALAAELTEAQWKDLATYRIMVGDPSGEMRADESVTRAEATKMICAAVGLSDFAADQANTFPDVPSTHWASGYVGVAQSMKLVEGNEAGLFEPERSVTNEEMLKLVICALGYEPMAQARGGYPAGFTALGTQLGITKGMQLAANTPATRSDAAMMLTRALDVPVMAQTGFGDAVEYMIMDGSAGTRLRTLRVELEEIATQ